MSTIVLTKIDPSGDSHQIEVPEDEAGAYVAQGYHAETTGERLTREEGQLKEERKPGMLGAAVLGLARGATLGLSDAPVKLFGGGRYAREAEEAHPIVSTTADIAGALIPTALTGGATAEESAASLADTLPAALVPKAGSAVRELAGGGTLGAIAANAAEGAIYGAGQGVSELALSDDPLTAEHVASVLSSNMLLGGAIGGIAGGTTQLVQRGLARAGDKLATAATARTAIAGVPEDLAGLDDAGLGVARKAAVGDQAAQVTAERQSLEELRVNQRAELANQIRDLHENLMDERPIFQAVTGDDVGAIDGVKDIRVQLAKSYKAMRSGLDSELSVARDPTSMIRPLEMRQAALEKLQAKTPELLAILGDDSRAAALAHVDDALAETKQQIASIRALNNRITPLSSGRLTMLEGGPSERIQQIDAAREALRNGPELGIIGKGAKAGAFAGGTALAHMIPGVGIAAPFVGKAAADAVESLFTRAAGAVGKVSEKASAAAQKFVTASKALEPYAAPTATKVLAGVRFGASKTDVPEDDLGALYRQRTAELYQQTMRQPDGTTVMRPEARAQMAVKLDPIRQVNPLLADKIETVQARKVAYLAQVAPKKPDPPALQIGPDRSRPSDLAIRAWARVIRALEDPESVEERLARGLVTPEEAAAYRAVYPERFAALQREIFAIAPTLDKTLPMGKKVALSIFTGIPVTRAMQPNVIAVLQQTFDVEPGSAGGTQAPRPQPNFGAMGSLRDMDKPTPAQERQQP